MVVAEDLGVTPPWAARAVAVAAAEGEDVGSALAVARNHGRDLPLSGRGATAQRWAVLAGIGRVNLTAARVFEAHTDALAILAEAEADDELPRASTWGVFAAESPHDRLDATMEGASMARLDGVKPWCSLGGALDHALVTAHVDKGRRLFGVDLRHPSVHPMPAEGWVARGLRTVTSVPVRFDATPARAVGEVGWYLRRPGFAWGGMGVAACWFGGALGLTDTLRRHAATRDGELNALHVGRADAVLHGARCTLLAAAAQIDAHEADGVAGALAALRVRAVVADACERVLRTAGHALGPAPLAFDADHAARVADLELYLRQHHAERDLAALGAAALGTGEP